MDDLSEIGAIAQQVKQSAATERNATPDGSVPRDIALRGDPSSRELALERMDRAEGNIARKEALSKQSGRAGRGVLAGRNEPTRQPISLLQLFTRDHSPGRHDVRAVSAFAEERRGPPV